MENLGRIIAALIIASTIITATVNFAKPMYEKLGFANSISILLSFILGIARVFALREIFSIEVSGLLTVLVGLAVGTGATIWYDVWKIVQNFWSTKAE